MKKKVIFGILVGLLIMFGTVGCGDKKAITAGEFKTKMEAEEFKVIDTMDQLPEGATIKQSYLALSPDSKYKIEFYEFTSDEEAAHFYEQNKKIFQTTKKNGYTEKEVNVGNHSKFHMNSGGKYRVVSRVANTAIYLDVKDSYKEVTNEILKKLGY